MPPSLLSRSIGLLVGLCMGLWPLMGQAAEPEAPSAAPDAAYTTRAGDTLEKIATQHYRGSPVQTQVLAKQLLERNAAALGPGAALKKRLKPGLALSLPPHEQMVRQALAPYLPDDKAARGASCGPDARRNWVHYP